MLELEIGLLDARRETVVQVLRADIHAVEQPVDQRALRRNDEVLHRHHRRAVVVDVAPERKTRNVAVDALLAVARIEQIDGHVRVVIRLPLRAERGADAVVLALRIHIARNARQEQAAAHLSAFTDGVHKRRIGCGCAGTRIVGTAVVGIRALGDAIGRVLCARPADRRAQTAVEVTRHVVDGRKAHFERIAVLIAQRP